MKRLLGLAILFVSACRGGSQPLSNWTAELAPCRQSGELLKHGHMEIGLWTKVSNDSLAAEIRRAMDFWANVLDMRWQERHDSQTCSIQVVDGSPGLFRNNLIAARSQFADRRSFHGWIAFNPKCPLTVVDAYLTAIHEIGHMLGLQHSPNPKSVMYFLDPESPPTLDEKDLALLRARHKLRQRGADLAAFAARGGQPSQGTVEPLTSGMSR
ncbi:MAG: matrixin family metalloprotease [Acidobacteriaceae bacterium]|nr:matrixin family metalloprotease [Acidobacteriaceae bacterium]